MNKNEWELYFIRQEIENQKTEQQRRLVKKRVRMITLSLVLLAGIIGGTAFVVSRSSEYGKLKSAVKRQDYRLAAVQMAQHVNEKYEAEVCSAEDLDCSFWDPSNTRDYIGVRGVSRENPGEQVYMLYLSKEEAVYLDTFQWEEISVDLEKEAAEATGLQEVSCDTYCFTDLDKGKLYYFCPWLAAGGYITKYEGNLAEFFQNEREAREALPAVEEMQGTRINGALAFYFEEPDIKDMEARLKNPSLPYAKRFEEGLKAMEEKYQVDIQSTVLYQKAYQEMKLALDEKMRSAVFPTKYIDYGEGAVFFNPAYTLLTMSRDEIFLPRAEQMEEGIYLFSPGEKKIGDVYEYKNTEPDKELQAKAEKELPGWTMKKTFCLLENTEEIFPFREYAMVLDWERLCESREGRIIGWSGVDWEIYEETAVPFPPEIRSDTYNMENGYMVVGNHIGYGEELDEFGARKHMNDVMFSIWTK